MDRSMSDVPGAAGIRLSGFYGAYFLLIGVMMPFWPLWLDHKGLTPVQIGTVLAVASWTKVALQPLIAGWADRGDAARRFVLLLSFGAMIGFLLLDWFDGFVAILVAATVTTGLLNPSLPLVESVALRCVDAWRLDYGRIRLWGSITFIAAAMGGGHLLAGRSEGLVIWMLSAAAVLVLAAAFALPRPPSRSVGVGRANPLRLLRLPVFLAVSLTGGLIAVSHAVYNGFATLIWRGQGISEGMIGGLWATGVIAEIVLFALAGRFADRLRPMILLGLAALAGLVRWPLLSVTTDPLALFALQTLHGLTFGAAHLGAMGFLRRAVPEPLAASGQALYYSFGGVMMGIAMPLAGTLYGARGAGAYTVMAMASALGLMGALWLARRWRGERLALA